MAMIDDIMQQLQDLGLGLDGGFSGISSLDTTQISQALQSQYGLSSSQLPISLFQPISRDLLRGTMPGTYTPQIEATGGTLLNKLQESIGGVKGRQAYGGFAGSGQQQQFLGEARDVYGKGMTDVLTQTGQQRAQSLGQIQDLINQWQSQALKIKGYQ
tara:strand:+ start:203 stop:676 length:474 start_codon:yes stop_codon:yes gene_type:complete